MNTSVASARIVAEAGVAATPLSLAASEEYIKRTRLARRMGIVLGLLAGFGPLASSSEGGNLFIPRVIAGYLVGLLAGEFFLPRPKRPTLRRASLRPRTSYDLLPAFARWLPWLTLVPVMASPLLLIGWHPRGASHVTLPNGGGSCSATATWPTPAYLFAVTGVAVVALVATELTLHRLRARQQPADEFSLRSLDHMLRGDSARAAIAASAALGLALIAQVLEAVDGGIGSDICTPGFTHHLDFGGNVYSWGASAEPVISGAGFALLVSAVVAYFVCRRLRVPPLPDAPEPQ